MKTGMLWHHESLNVANAPTTQLETLVQEAANDYHRFYGVYPSICYLNPSELGNHRRRLRRLNMKLSPSDQLNPGQFWLAQ